MTRRRRGGHGGGGGGGGGHGGGDARWMVTYADLLTLLMVLFLVLWVISTIDLKKFEKFKSGLGDFGNPAAEQEDPSAGQGLAEGSGSDPTLTVVETTVATEGSEPETGAGTGDGTGDGKGQLLDEQQLGDLVDGLQQAVDDAGLDSQISVSVDQRGLVITVSTDDVLFAAGSADLGPDAKAVLAAVAPKLSDLGNTIIVEGYTDKRPLRGRADYDNWDLSVDRAVSVVKVLRDTFGFAPARLAATGYGDQHPLAEGDDEAAYAKNRRVQIVVVPSEPGPDGTSTTESAG